MAPEREVPLHRRVPLACLCSVGCAGGVSLGGPLDSSLGDGGLLLGAIGASVDVASHGGVTADTDALTHDEGDSGASDTDRSSDTDSGGLADTSDTDLPADTGHPPPPPSWGAGFVVVGGDLELSYPAVEVGQAVGPVYPEQSTLAVGDIDGDGRVEVISTILTADFAPPVTRVYRMDAAVSSLTDDPPLRDGIAGRDTIGSAVGLIDVDGDGVLDLITQLASAPVRWGNGSGRFVAGAAIAGFVGTPWASSPSLWDVDGDGWNDLLFGPSAATAPVTYAQRTGPRTWAVTPGVVDPNDGDTQLRGILSFAQGGSQVHALIGVGAQMPAMNPGWLVGAHPSSDSLRVADWLSRPIWWQLLPATQLSGLLDVAAMGGTVADLDGDGWQDMVISPGFGKMSTFRGGPTGFVGSPTLGELMFPALEPHEIPLPWSVEAVDLDLDGHPEVIATFGDDGSSFSLASGAHQRNRVWRSGRGGVWSEVGADLNFDQPGGWMSMNVVDMDRDGDADVALGGDGRGPRLLRNDIDSAGHAISLRLVGTSSNLLALGADVGLDADGMATQSQQVTLGASPLAVAEPVLFFGLGTATLAREVRIAWPSGWSQVVHNLAGGALHEIVEPPVFQIFPADRRAAADGRSTITIEVTPRQSDGTVDTARAVELRLDGPGTLLAGTAGWDGGVWRAQIEAPSAAGATRVSVLVDGLAYAVRPRLIWE